MGLVSYGGLAHVGFRRSRPLLKFVGRDRAATINTTGDVPVCLGAPLPALTHPLFVVSVEIIPDLTPQDAGVDKSTLDAPFDLFTYDANLFRNRQVGASCEHMLPHLHAVHVCVFSFFVGLIP